MSTDAGQMDQAHVGDRRSGRARQVADVAAEGVWIVLCAPDGGLRVGVFTSPEGAREAAERLRWAGLYVYLFAVPSLDKMLPTVQGPDAGDIPALLKAVEALLS